MSSSSTSEVSSASSISTSSSLNNTNVATYSEKARRNKLSRITSHPSQSKSSSNTICTKGMDKSKSIPALQQITRKRYKVSRTRIPLRGNEVILNNSSLFECSRCRNNKHIEHVKKFVDEPLVKCNGHLCRRIYHLSCTNLPVNCIMYNSILHLHRQKQQSSKHKCNPIIIDVSGESDDPLSDSNNGHNLRNENDFKIFLCQNCDIEGSSKFLMEYLQPFNQKRNQTPLLFYPDNSNSRVKSKMANNSYTRKNQDINGNSNITKGNPIKSRQQNQCKKQWIQQQSEINYEKINKILRNRSDQIDKHQIFKKETKNKSSEKHQDCDEMYNNNKIKHDLCDKHKPISLSSSCSTFLSQTDRGDMYEKNYEHLIDKLKHKSATPSIFIGQPVKLYCPIDNSYHVGRIIDMRKRQRNKRNIQTCTNSNHEESNKDHNDRERYPLNQVEFLIRFRAGMNGRKITVHGWIVLEEHSLMVGIMLIWVQFNLLLSQNLSKKRIKGYNDDYDSQNNNINNHACKKQLIPYYSPAQVMLRSGLEMLALNENKSSSVSNLSANLNNDEKKSTSKENTNNAFVLFFGKDINTHASINMMSKSINFCPPPPSFLLPLYDASHHQTAQQSKSTQFNNFNPNDQNDRRFLAFSIAMASIENEEQKYIRKSHNLSTACQQIFLTETGPDYSLNTSRNLHHLQKVTYLPQIARDDNKLASSIHAAKTTAQISLLNTKVVVRDSHDNSSGINSFKDINGKGNHPNIEQNGHNRKQRMDEDDDTNFETESESESINSS